MDVFEAIEKRRVYRSLDPVEMSQGPIVSLAKCASLAHPILTINHGGLFLWLILINCMKYFQLSQKITICFTDASMVIAVFTKKELDCVMKDGREYFFFNIGIALELVILRVTGMSPVARAIAGESLLF